MRRNQRTIKSSFELSGVGLHTGGQAKVKVSPSDADSGVVFVRKDLPGRAGDSGGVPLHLRQSAPHDPQERRGRGPHRRAPLRRAHGARRRQPRRSRSTGRRCPASTAARCRGPRRCRRRASSSRSRRASSSSCATRSPSTVGDSFITAVPSEDEGLVAGLHARLPESAVRSQYFAMNVEAEAFTKAIAPARTFCFEAEVEELRKRGLGKGATLENTIVVRNPPDPNQPLRFADEPVRHKVLDLMGDLFLLGADLQARVVATKSGHARQPRAGRPAAATSEADEAARKIESVPSMDDQRDPEDPAAPLSRSCSSTASSSSRATGARSASRTSRSTSPSSRATFPASRSCRAC